MRKKFLLMAGVGACLALAGCQSGPSSSASSRTAEEERALAVERKIEFLEDALGRRGTAARLMDELAAALPERVWLTEVLYEAGEARIKGRAWSNTLLVDYLARLESSAALAEVMLQSSAQASGRDRDSREFALRVLARDIGGETTGAGGTPETRLAALEKLLPGRDETSEFFRQFQRLASDAGLQMTKFAPAGSVPGEPYEEWAAAIEVMGGQAALRRFFSAMTGLPRLWVVEKFSFKTLAADDSRSPVRVSIEARTLFRE
jgi:hypothetical protein